MAYYTTTEKSAMDRDGRNMKNAGVALSGELEDIRMLITSSSIGATAEGGDIDSLALDGGHFSRDPDNDSGLTFAYKAGRLFNGTAIVSVAAGTVLLSSSTTNYVEVSRAGVVSKNTVGFTAGSIPLYEITTGASTITAVANRKTLLSSLPNGGWPGSTLSVAAATKELLVYLGAIPVTASFSLVVPATAGTLARVSFVTATAVAASDTNYWTIGLVNKGAAGSGTTVMVDEADALNSTKVTGGAAMSANIKRSLTLSGTPANLVVAAEDALVLTFTKTASATTMVQCAVRLDFTFAT
jgi:hypothetical protein